jgi:hypothetical protein
VIRLLGRLCVVLVVAGACATAAGTAVAEKRVQPSAHPSRPTASQEVVIRFRTRETLDGRYYAEAQHLPGEAACDVRRSRSVTASREGRVVRLRVRPPRVDGESDARRWCIGTYRAKVFFKQTVRCEPPVQCGDSVARAIGSTRFTVVADY